MDSLKKTFAAEALSRRIVTFLGLGLLLYWGKALFIPLSFGAILALIIYPFFRFLRQRNWGEVAAISASILLIVLVFLAFATLIFFMFSSFLAEWKNLEREATELLAAGIEKWAEWMGMSREEFFSWIRSRLGDSGAGIIGSLKSLVQETLTSLVLILLVPVISTLVLYYRRNLMGFLYHAFPSEKPENIRHLMEEVTLTYYRFIKGMAMVYLIVGILNSLGLYLLGIPYALLFGFLAAIMTFIPYVGILIASVLPIVFAWISYGTIWHPLGVVLVFAVVQILEANVIFPFAVGSRLNLSPLAVLIVILAGGILWGAAGMILFIPFAAILKIIAEKSGTMPALLHLLQDSRNEPTKPVDETS